MFYLDDTDKPRLFIKSSHLRFDKPIYVGTTGTTQDHKDNLARVLALIDKMNRHIGDGKSLQICHNPHETSEIYVKWDDVPWGKWELVLSNKFKFTKELIGYKQPIVFENTVWNNDHPKGSIWTKYETRKVRDQNLYRHGSDSNAMLLPAEIVESWEPVYKEDKTVQLMVGDILEMLGLQYDPEIKIKLL